MASEALTLASEMYATYINAEKAVLQNQEYTIGDRTFKKADLQEIQSGREYWKKEVLKEAMPSRKARMRGVIPRD